MKISTKGRYALRTMLELAMNGADDYISIKEIAFRQGISEKYLEQIISKLAKAGFVKSVRGAQGGYMLSKKPEEYKIGDILRLLEGSLTPVSCLENGVQACERKEFCVTLEIWKEIDEAIKGVVDRITLADLVERRKEKTYGKEGIEI